MKKLSFLLLSIILTPALLPGQNSDGDDDPKRSTLDFSTGYFNYASIDALFSGNIYSGGAPFISVGYQKQKRTPTQTIFRLAYINRYPHSLNLHETVVPATSNLRLINHMHFEVDDFYFFPVPGLSRNNLTVSIMLNWFSSIDLTMNNRMMPEQLLSTIAPGFMMDFNHSRHHIQARVSTALISYTCRSNYSNTLPQDYEKLSIGRFIRINSRLQLPNSLQTIFSEINYKYSFSDKIGGVVYYNFRYLHNAKPRTLAAVSGTYGFGIYFKY